MATYIGILTHENFLKPWRSTESIHVIWLLLLIGWMTRRDHGRRGRFHQQRKNQSLWFCWVFSLFLFFSRLILSGSLLYFTGKQSRYFLLTKPFPVSKYNFLFSFIYLDWPCSFYMLRFEFSQCDIWYMRFSLDYEQRVRTVWMVYSECKMSYNLLLVWVVHIRAKWPIRPELILVSVAWSDWEYFYSPLDGMLVLRGVTPDIKLAGIHVSTWVERGTVRVKCLDQEHNTMSPAKAWTRTARRRLH